MSTLCRIKCTQKYRNSWKTSGNIDYVWLNKKYNVEIIKLSSEFTLFDRQKRSMGLTLAESELAKLDAERSRERQTREKERLCAEPILQKIDEIL